MYWSREYKSSSRFINAVKLRTFLPCIWCHLRCDRCCKFCHIRTWSELSNQFLSELILRWSFREMIEAIRSKTESRMHFTQHTVHWTKHFHRGQPYGVTSIAVALPGCRTGQTSGRRGTGPMWYCAGHVGNTWWENGENGRRLHRWPATDRPPQGCAYCLARVCGLLLTTG